MEGESNFEITGFSNKITEKEIFEFFQEKSIMLEKVEISDSGDSNVNIKVFLKDKDFPLALIQDLEDSTIGNYPDKLKIKLPTSETTSILEKAFNKYRGLLKFLEYQENYAEQIKTDYIRNKGDNSLIFVNEASIQKQKGIILYLLKKLGSNIIHGQSIMSISLPVSIFDERSLLEVFAHRNVLCPYFLEKAGQEDNLLERMKFTTTYAISMLHNNATQLKPFNPILGETFQCKIGSVECYLEQSSHHPPRYHFQLIGNNFKSYGFQEVVAITNPNGVVAKYPGIHYVEYPDGGKYRIITANLEVTGLMMGKRTFNYLDKLFVVDEKNDFISVVEFNPDERGFFSKIVGKKNTFPDYFKGFITKKSQCVYNKKSDTYSVNDKPFVFSKIEGEWTDYLKFDDMIYWEYSTFAHFKLEKFPNLILPSDSLYREDLIIYRSKNEIEAQKSKVKLEEIQRNDRKLRKEYSSKSH